MTYDIWLDWLAAFGTVLAFGAGYLILFRDDNERDDHED